MATVSFILRYYNEEKYIGECLNAIARQKGGHDIQIILINDKSTDRSDEVITSFKTDNPQLDILKIDLESKFTFSSAINKAIPYIKGEYSVIHSVHATLATDEWLDIILKNFVNKLFIQVELTEILCLNLFPRKREAFLIERFYQITLNLFP